MKEIIDYIVTYLYIYYLKLKNYFKKIKQFVIKNQKIIGFILILLLIILLIYFNFGNDTFNMSGGGDDDINKRDEKIEQPGPVPPGPVPPGPVPPGPVPSGPPDNKNPNVSNQVKKYENIIKRRESKIGEYQGKIEKTTKKNQKALGKAEKSAKRAKKTRTQSAAFNFTKSLQNRASNVGKKAAEELTKFLLLPFGALVGPPIGSTIYGVKPLLENISVV